MWLQLSPWRDREASEVMVERAKAADFSGLCLTVDVPVGAKRERDLRNNLSLPFRVTARNAVDVASRPGWLPTAYYSMRKQHGNHPTDPKDGGGAVSMAKWVTHTMNPSATWDEVRWLRTIWPGHLLVKGVLRADDAQQARDAGADAVVVSNHGGRQLDSAIASMRALPDVVATVGSEIDVLVDGGFRRGSDVVKAMALGAKACLIARPYVLSLALGDPGPRRILEIFRSEIDTTMALLGARGWDEIDSSMIEVRRG